MAGLDKGEPSKPEYPSDDQYGRRGKDPELPEIGLGTVPPQKKHRTVVVRMLAAKNPARVAPLEVVRAKHSELAVYEVFPGALSTIAVASNPTEGREHIIRQSHALVSYGAFPTEIPGRFAFRIIEKEYADWGMFDDLDDLVLWFIQCDVINGEVIHYQEREFGHLSGVIIKSDIG